jgi:sugar lactone lactonase YvrE
VADTENHLLRKVDLEKKTVTTISGTGKQRREPYWPGLDPSKRDANGDPVIPKRWVDKPRTTAINSPWALWIHEDDLYIAMAGPHQIWKMPLDQREIGPFAGNGREDIVDGDHLPQIPYTEGFSSFAQPSGLASDGTNLFVADSEGSSIRAVPFDTTKAVSTVVGTAKLEGGRLFVFGDRDGEGMVAFKVPGVYRTAADSTGPLLQHPIDCLYHDGLIYVADTYNNRIKAVDPKKRSITTVAGTGKPGSADGEAAEFDEPAGLAYAKGKLYVADTNGHRIRVIDLANKNTVSTLALAGLEPPPPPKAESGTAFKDAKQVHVKHVTLKPEGGTVKFAVDLTLPAGYKINKLAPMKYQVDVPGAEGAFDRAIVGKPQGVAEPATKFEIALPVKGTGDEKLKISLVYYYCKEGNEGLCKVGTVTWNVPVTLAADGEATKGTLTYEAK